MIQMKREMHRAKHVFFDKKFKALLATTRLFFLPSSSLVARVTNAPSTNSTSPFHSQQIMSSATVENPVAATASPAAATDAAASGKKNYKNK